MNIFTYFKSFFSRKESKQIIDETKDRVTITTHFKDRVEIKKYKLLNSLTTFKTD